VEEDTQTFHFWLSLLKGDIGMTVREFDGVVNVFEGYCDMSVGLNRMKNCRVSDIAAALFGLCLDILIKEIKIVLNISLAKERNDEMINFVSLKYFTLINTDHLMR
jgi:hypothetical protein